jgi:hypothetical protein
LEQKRASAIESSVDSRRSSMAGDAYITNPDAQQGEPTSRKGVRAPANTNAKVHPTIPPADSADEGPVDIPEHAGKRPAPSLDKLKP